MSGEPARQRSTDIKPVTGAVTSRPPCQALRSKMTSPQATASVRGNNPREYAHRDQKPANVLSHPSLHPSLPQSYSTQQVYDSPLRLEAHYCPRHPLLSLLIRPVPRHLKRIWITISGGSRPWPRSESLCPLLGVVVPTARRGVRAVLFLHAILDA